jgi:multidrug resistance efflux pump
MTAFRPPIYRKEALAKVSSPEELDRLMQITSVRAWLILAGIGCVLAIALLWGVFGKLTTTVEGAGTLTLSNPIAVVTAPDWGRISLISVQPNDSVKAGQVIAQIMASTDNSAKNVISPVNGRVIAVRATAGTQVSAGTPLISIESFDSIGTIPLQVILYVSLTEGQQIQKDAPVQIEPSIAPHDQYGYLLGSVASVSPYAATREEMLTVLKDGSRVDDRIAKGQIFEVRIRLLPFPEGGFLWSNGHRPSFNLVSDTPCDVTIIVRSESLLSRLFSRSSS